MNVSIFGLGYVGLANALLLSQHENVKAYDIVAEKIERLQKKESPIEDREVHNFLQREDLAIEFIKDFREAVLFGDYLIIATPTDTMKRKIILIPHRLRASLNKLSPFAQKQNLSLSPRYQ